MAERVTKRYLSLKTMSIFRSDQLITNTNKNVKIIYSAHNSRKGNTTWENLKSTPLAKLSPSQEHNITVNRDIPGWPTVLARCKMLAGAPGGQTVD